MFRGRIVGDQCPHYDPYQHQQGRYVPAAFPIYVLCNSGYHRIREDSAEGSTEQGPDEPRPLVWRCPFSHHGVTRGESDTGGDADDDSRA